MGAGAALREVEVDAVQCEEPLSLDLASVTASSAADAFPAASAADGDLGSLWQPFAKMSVLPAFAVADEPWLQLDLGGTHTLRGVRILWGNDHATVWSLSLSVDGSAWTPAFSHIASSDTVNAPSAAYVTFSASASLPHARLLRVTIHDGCCCGGRRTRTGSIREIEVY